MPLHDLLKLRKHTLQPRLIKPKSDEPGQVYMFVHLIINSSVHR